MKARRYEVVTQLDTGEPGKFPTLNTEWVDAYTAADAITQVRLACRNRAVFRYWVPGHPHESSFVTPTVVTVRPAPTTLKETES